MMRHSPQVILPFLLVFGAILGQPLYILFFLLFFFYRKYSDNIQICFPVQFKPFFLILFVWLLIEFYYQFNSCHLFFYCEEQDLLARFSNWWQTCVVVINLYLIILSYSFFRHYKFSEFRFGILLAVIFAQALTAFQIAFSSNFLGNQTDFWFSQGRFPSVFSDPNAFGLSSFLIIGILLSFYRKDLRSKSLFAIIVIQIVLTIFSGSRTFFLGMILLSAGLIFAYKRVLFLYSFLAFALGAFFVSYFLGEAELVGVLPNSFVRIINSFSYGDIGQTFFSRQVFNELNLLIFKDFPIFGIGINNFSSQMPEYKGLLENNIGNWVDNNNDFYFGLLSELGIFGFLAFLLGISGFRLDSKRDSVLSITVIVFLLLLFLGPHFYFTEVSLLFGLLISQTLSFRETKIEFRKYFLILMLIALVGIISNTRYQTRGLYGLESHEEKDFSWSKKEGAIYVDCKKVKYVEWQEVNPAVKILAIDIYKFQDLPILPLRQIKDFSTNKKTFYCPNDLDKYQVRFKLSGTWVPRELDSNSTDSRFLGVKVSKVFRTQN